MYVNAMNLGTYLESKATKNIHGTAILKRHNKRFWIGAVDILDGYITEVYTYEKAKEHDFHHTLYFSASTQEKIDHDESLIFWIMNGDVHSWEKIESTLKQKIRDQITILP